MRSLNNEKLNKSELNVANYDSKNEINSLFWMFFVFQAFQNNSNWAPLDSPFYPLFNHIIFIKFTPHYRKLPSKNKNLSIFIRKSLQINSNWTPLDSPRSPLCKHMLFVSISQHYRKMQPKIQNFSTFYHLPISIQLQKKPIQLTHQLLF
jgi:hypothetical protein